MANLIKLIPVKELLGKKFNIPSYQRGYKWTNKQADDLLNDLYEFMTNGKSNSNPDSFYCLQPLAVAPKSKEKSEKFDINEYKTEQEAIEAIQKLFNECIEWDVIDGQQRLTTIYLLLCYLKCENLYSISYETRNEDYLNSYNKIKQNAIGNDIANSNVDYYHIDKVYKYIETWFKEKSDEVKKDFKEIILNQTQFIWYETDEDPIKVFTRLNIGKIRLTNSELIKSMIMSQTKDVVRQHEIASEWDMIEQQLQNDEFWYFVHGADYDKPTRIDFLFDTLCEYDLSKLNNKNNKKDTIKKYIGTDQYSTFRYYDYVLKNKGIGIYNKENIYDDIWEKVKILFYVINEWYNDIEFYHYIGYLLCHEKNTIQIYKEWQKNGTKDGFKNYLKGEIKGILAGCCKQYGIGRGKILNQQYEIDVELNQNKKDAIFKTVCRPILLLHNIQTVINQNKPVAENDEFKHFIFYRFPFHLYKTEKWDVEHIDSNTTNDLKDDFSKLLWMLQFFKECYRDKSVYKYIYDNIYVKNVIKFNGGEYGENEIKKVIKDENFFEKFDDLVKEVESVKDEEAKKANNLTYEEKNQIGNFTLLDASTNRGYGNSIFPKKRLTIMAKDRCQEYQLKFKQENGSCKFVSELVPAPKNSTFIPPVTRNIFMKYYTPETSDFVTWNRADFVAYKKDIETVLSEFLQDNDENINN